MRILINNLYYPQLVQSSFQLSQQASDPVPTCNFTLNDEGVALPLAEFQEVIVIDETAYPIPPTHNFLINPVMNPYNSNGWQTSSNGGVTLAQHGGGGMDATFSNAAMGVLDSLSQQVPTPSLSVPQTYVQPGQTYTFSCTVVGSGISHVQANVTILWTTVTGVQTGVGNSAHVPGGSPVVISVTDTAPAGTAFATVILGAVVGNATNSGTVTYTDAQFEANWFPDLQSYPSAYCDGTQANTYVLPDGTAIREKRKFAGWITLFDFEPVAGGPVAEWMLSCSAYGWIFDKRTNNSTFTSIQDDAMIIGVVSSYFSGRFTTNHVVAAPLTISSLQYSYDTLRKMMDDICTLTGQRWTVDPYGDVWYVPQQFAQASYGLTDGSDSPPDNIRTFAYSRYKYTGDFTQPTNDTTIKINVPSPGSIGIARIEHGQARARYGIVFEKYIDDSQIIDQGMAHTRGIAENIQYAYARPTIHLELDEQESQEDIAPGVSIQITSSGPPPGFIARSFLIQKVAISILASGDNTLRTRYKYSVDLGAYNPNIENLIIKNFVQVASSSTILPNPTAQWNMANETIGYNESVTH